MTISPDLSPDEPMRLAALRAMSIVETPLEERFERVTRMAKRLLGVDVAAISLVEADRQWFKSIQGVSTCETPRSISFCGHAILQDGPFIVPDATEDERFKDNPMVTGPPFVRFYAGVPVHSVDGFRVGMMCVNHCEPREVTEEDLQVLKDLAAMAETELRTASSAAVQAELIAQASATERRGMIDELTRVWNRRGIMEMSQGLGGKGCGVGVLMLDLDGFKPVNDTHGHEAGDEALRVVARRLLGAARETDVVGRLGGDEFVVVLTECAGEGEAREVAERVLARVAGEPIGYEGASFAIGVSVGLAVAEAGEGVSLKSLLSRADVKMYEAKRGGAGRVAA